MKKIITVLSVRQPWAWLIIAGLKPIENRTWATNYRGELYIHAGKSFDWDAMFWFAEQREVRGSGIVLCQHFGIKFGVSPENSKITKHLDEFGAIIGRVNLVDCDTNSKSIWAESGCNHWFMRDPSPITPIPLRGQLGLFKAEIEVPE